MESDRFDFEKLHVYWKAIEFADQVFVMTDGFPQRLQYSVGDQFRRAALSVCNNLAEGSQKHGAAKRQFYGDALDSARECVPMLELARRRALIVDARHDQFRQQCVEICKMLYGLIRKIQ